ncbi:MAG: hypothetical protein Q4D16_25380, partial [Eubacteriales bacterium]|nr:hypothetical protein [Eubacteriales bacterium]
MITIVALKITQGKYRVLTLLLINCQTDFVFSEYLSFRHIPETIKKRDIWKRYIQSLIGLLECPITIKIIPIALIMSSVESLLCSALPNYPFCYLSCQ